MSYKFTFQLTLSLGDKDYTPIADCQDECCVCLESGGKEWVKLECKHQFHKKCIVEYLRVAERKTCPMCRSPVQNDYSCVVS